MKYLNATNQRRIHRKEWILGRYADEQDQSRFDIGKQDILLRPIEPVNFIEKKNCALPSDGEFILRLVKNSPHILDAHAGGVELNEFAFGVDRDELRASVVFPVPGGPWGKK